MVKVTVAVAVAVPAALLKSYVNESGPE